jgi:hypothetical protein
VPASVLDCEDGAKRMEATFAGRLTKVAMMTDEKSVAVAKSMMETWKRKG